MDILQVVLIGLTILLGVFLSITGLQVFFILRDLKKALDRMNKILQTDEVKEKISAAALKHNHPTRRLFKNVK